MVRKRPLSSKEASQKHVDVITCPEGGRNTVVHEPKTRVDCSRHVESQAFSFDASFDDCATNAEVYAAAVGPLVRLCLRGGRCCTRSVVQTLKLSEPSSEHRKL